MICVICKSLFVAKRSDSKCCSQSCKLIYGRDKARTNYQTSFISKDCRVCNRLFQATAKQQKCETCRKKRNLEVKIKDLHCPRCKTNVVGHKEVLCLFTAKSFSRSLCFRCKEESLKQIRTRMGSDKNPAIQIHGRKKVLTKQEQQEKLIKNKTRMKNNNPMFDKEIVRKAIETKQKRNYIYKRGKKHHLWKGNRDRAQTIRSRLYSIWTLPIMERDCFTCSKCRKTKTKLEVHHIDPFRTILKQVLKDRILSDLTEDQFEKISLEIEDIHKNGNIRGITYCVSCHKKVDERRR